LTQLNLQVYEPYILMTKKTQVAYRSKFINLAFKDC